MHFIRLSVALLSFIRRYLTSIIKIELFDIFQWRKRSDLVRVSVALTLRACLATMLPICERLVEVGQLGGARSASRWLYSQPRVVKKLQSYPYVCCEAVVSRSLSPPHSGVPSSSSPLLLDRLGVARLGQPPTFSGQSVDEGFQQGDITIPLFDLTQQSTTTASENIVDTHRVISQNNNMVIKGQPLNMKQQIYCGGSLLDAVQKARIFQDCKHFVDMPLKADAGMSHYFPIFFFSQFKKK